ncbi:peptidase M23, partial [Vibrio splendidus]
MKFLPIGLIVIAISAFSLSVLLHFQSEAPEEISIQVTPYKDLLTHHEGASNLYTDTDTD